MPTFGGYAPFPVRLGGSGPSVVEGITDALNESRGTAYDTSTDSPVWVENHADARCIASIWHTNERLSKLYVLRCTPVLERWEKIFGIVPPFGATLRARHDAIAERRARTGFVPKPRAISDALKKILTPIAFEVVTQEWNDPHVRASHPGLWRVDSDTIGAPIPTVIGIVTNDVELALVITTAGNKSSAQMHVSWTIDGVTSAQTVATSSPMTVGETGLTITFPEGSYELNAHYACTALVDGWTSSLAHIRILTTPPGWMTSADYLDISTRVYSFLDAVLPAWVTFDVVRGDVFRLDVQRNLDRSRLA